jgi:hypothetical protein
VKHRILAKPLTVRSPCRAERQVGADFHGAIHESLALLPSESVQITYGTILMGISSTSATTPTPPSFTTETKPPAASSTGDTDKPTWQPPAKSPLPPGQGTRVDQLV